MSWDTTIPFYRAIREQAAALDDAALEKALASATAANDPHANAAVWLKALKEETAERTTYRCDAGCGFVSASPGRCGGCDVGELVKDASAV